MPVENVIGLVFVGILAVVLAVVLSTAEKNSKNIVAYDLPGLEAVMQLTAANNWEIAVMRRSGYVHSGWTIAGTRREVLNFAISKLRKARIDTVSIVRNEMKVFEVRAYYESAGSRRTGKYVGGFVITPKA